MILRLMKWATMLGIVSVACLATYLWGETTGRWAKDLSLQERNAMLAPFDEVFVPDAARFGPPPYPGVVLLHNCYGGLDQLRDWATLFQNEGIIVHISDSLAGRGLGHPIMRTLGCYSALFYPVERAGDVMSALGRFRDHGALDSSRIAIMGLSHGGTTLFEALAVTARGAPPPGYQQAFSPTAFNGVVAQIVMYPNCGIRHQAREFSASVPLLWLHGEADQVTPLDECADMMDYARTAGTPINLHRFAGANHNFDMLEGGLRNPDAAQGAVDRQRAQAVVLSFLRQHLLGD